MTIDSFTTDQICAFLTSTDQTRDDRIEEHAKEYALACEQANGRLKRCRLFLETGNRSQAIRFAEQDPPLRKLVEQLSLNGMVDLWEEAVATYGWPRFQPLKSDVLELIEEAYPVERQTEDILYKYRESCLAKAPLSERLLLVRQLALLDPTNTSWQSDIEQLEKSLMAELEQRGQDAIESDHLDELALVISQHDDHQWSSELPPSYQRFLQRAVPVAYRDFLIPKEVSEYKQALKEKRVDDLVILHDRIRQMHTLAKACDSEFELNEKTGRDFEHITSELKKYQDSKRAQLFNHDLQLLQAMLGGKHSKEQIQSALENAQSHGIPVPPVILAHVEVCLANLKDTRILTTIAITALIILVIGLAVLAFLLWGKLS